MKRSNPTLALCAALVALILNLPAEEAGLRPSTAAPRLPENRAKENAPPSKGNLEIKETALLEAGVGFTTADAIKAKEQFLKLPEEKRNEFYSHLKKATDFLTSNRLQEAAEAMTNAERFWPEHPEVLTAKGSILSRLHDYDRATQYFSHGVALYPDCWQMLCNLAEMEYVRKDFKKAEAHFSSVLEKFPKLDLQTARLVEYSIILCLVRQGKLDQAKKRTDKYDAFDETPIFYYSMAALHFQKGETKDGVKWLTDARKVFDAGSITLYEDGLKEAGCVFAP